MGKVQSGVRSRVWGAASSCVEGEGRGGVFPLLLSSFSPCFICHTYGFISLSFLPPLILFYPEEGNKKHGKNASSFLIF